MQAALHQNLIAAEIDGLLNLLQKHVAIEHVAFGMSRLAVERAEIADGRADVGVVDVAVDVVGAIRLGMEPARDGVGSSAHGREIVRLDQSQASAGESRSPAIAFSRIGSIEIMVACWNWCRARSASKGDVRQNCWPILSPCATGKLLPAGARPIATANS